MSNGIARVEALGWAAPALPPGGSVDTDTGLMRDETGAVFSIDDNITVPPGTRGTVVGSDDAGTWLVDWDNGARLSIIPGVDRYRIVT